MIYEARPNVTVDAAGICIKTGNAVILRGGSTAIHSNIILSNVIAEAAVQAGLPEGCIQLIQTTDREAVNILFTMNQYLDVLIPRGGAGLIQSVVNNSTVPVIETGTGICHAYVDAEADLQMAVDIVNNGKSQRPSVCNSLETVLVHQDVAEQFYPMLEEAFKEKNVLIRACENSSKFLAKSEPATEEDYRTEYLDYIISGKVVKDIDEAMDHIAEYGTHHSDVIITKSYDQSRKFLAGVDSAAVYVNASTRFTDGEMFGFGAEIGISTQKLHARGPMGLEELTTYKYVIYGSGQIRG
jgi:glutamate-5-semialdehyde dehydrogenase